MDTTFVQLGELLINVKHISMYNKAEKTLVMSNGKAYDLTWENLDEKELIHFQRYLEKIAEPASSWILYDDDGQTMMINK